MIEAPLHWKRGRLVFVNSMSDLFHRNVPLEYIQRCFEVMQQASQHTFQILTKRPDYAAEIAGQLPCRRTSGWERASKSAGLTLIGFINFAESLPMFVSLNRTLARTIAQNFTSRYSMGHRWW